MALPDLTGLNIEDTYQRVLHTDGVSVYDGTGSLFILPSTNTSSLLITASATSNQITFTKGDASQFTITVDTGSSSAFTGIDQEILFISGSTVTGSNDLLFDYNASTLNVNGDLYVSSSTGTIIDTSATSLGFGGVTSVDWGNRNLWDANGVIVLDWLSLQLLDSGGGTAVDWGSRRTTDSVGTVSMNWDSRELFDDSAVDSVNWSNRRLFNDNGTQVLSWRNGILFDGLTSQSINWDSRRLFGPNGQVTLDWANNNIARVTGSLMLTGSLVATQSFISKVQYIDYELLTTAPAFSEGRLHWSDDTKTIEIDTDVSGFEIEVGHVNVVRVVNKTGAPLAAGKVVFISGSQGNRPTVVTASWDGDMTSATTLGFVAQTINDNNNGYVVTNGLLRNINTNAYPAGTQLYLSSSGDWTSTIPVSPKHEVRLGKVITQNATTGIIYVNVMNGYELGELHDVLITTPSNGQALVYSSSLWVNQSIPKVIKKENITFASSSWVSQSLYVYTYTDTDIAASSSIVDFTPNTASFSTVVNAIVYPTVVVTTGTASFFAINQPANNITGELVITNI